MRTKRSLDVVPILVVLIGGLSVGAPQKAVAGSSSATFTLTSPGVARDASDTLLVAAQLNNQSRKTAFKVKIKSIRLDSALPLTPLPIPVGDLRRGRGTAIEAAFNESGLAPGV